MGTLNHQGANFWGDGIGKARCQRNLLNRSQYSIPSHASLLDGTEDPKILPYFKVNPKSSDTPIHKV